jgi:DNA-binding CsgD family transcriptional regulator
MDAQFIDRIYESSFIPEFWPEVLDELGRVGGAPGASLFVATGGTQYCLASPEPRERAERIVKEGWLRRGSIIGRLFDMRHAGFLVDVDYLTPEELEREPIYRDLWRPLGVGWGVATAIPMPTGDNAIFVLSRRMERGPFDRSDALRLDAARPHLARSVLISARLQLERASAASKTLAAMGIPALVFNDHYKVVSANSLIESVGNAIQWRAFGRVSLKDRIADRLLRDALSAINSEDNLVVRSFPVRDPDAGAMKVAHVIPVRLSARDIFVRSVGVLTLTPVTAPLAPPVELVQSLFDLTSTEARVARSLAMGKTAKDIATDGGISLNTVRTHVRGVLEKTGCNRQAQVIALLNSVSSGSTVAGNGS